MAKVIRILLLISLIIGAWYVHQQKYLPDLAPSVLVNLSGTGSMYPTFPKGVGRTDLERSQETVTSIPMYSFSASPTAFSRIFTKNSLGRSDIVSFKNPTTDSITLDQYGRSTGFVKRVIALPGDTLEIRDGYILLNASPLPEPYTALPHSTFGGKFLPDCHPVTIPTGFAFVMGDNRKSSNDSRHDVGLVNLADIDHILPLPDQKGKYDSSWRDTSEDFLPKTKIRIDKQKYLDLLNAKRRELGSQPLKENLKLSQSAHLRGEAMLKSNDLSYTATRSGLTQSQALAKVGYWNPVWGETWQTGYYSSQELLENQLEFPDTTKFLLDPQFQDIGVWETEGLLNGCPTQIVVQHFAGYVPPNYKKEVVDSWVSALESLRRVQPGWADLKSNGGPFYEKYKPDINRINDIIATRISHATAIVSKMTSNRWLSTTENKWAEEDRQLAQEQSSLADSINSR